MQNHKRENEPLHLSGESLGDLFFSWNGDRYHHKWAFPDSACHIESIESDSSQMWPVSPPLQQIHQQSFGDGREVVFGVGMSGRGHWSVSFTLVPELKSWIVELACRSPVEPEQLMSSYALGGQWTVDSADQIRCQEPGTIVSLEAIAPSCQAQMSDSEADLIRFSPVQIAGNSSTTQWAFRVRVETA